MLVHLGLEKSSCCLSRFFPPRADVTAETNRGRAESCGLRRASVASTALRGYRLNTAMASDRQDERRPLIGRVDGSGAPLDPSSPRALEEGAGGPHRRATPAGSTACAPKQPFFQLRFLKSGRANFLEIAFVISKYPKIYN